MKIRNLFPFVFILINLLLSSCGKEELAFSGLDHSSPDLSNQSQISVPNNIQGTITNAIGEGIDGTVIQIVGQSTRSNEHGDFLFNDLEVQENGALIHSEKEGYFKSTKFVQPNDRDLSDLQIELIEKELNASIASEEGGRIDMEGGAYVILSPNSVQYKNGEAFNGEIKVYAHWINPTNVAHHKTIPGDMKGVDLSNEFVQLETFGTVVLELENANGVPLELKEDATATVAFPVAPKLLSKAPAIIPLWHFDEDSGYWIEDGKAIFQGDKYVCEVNHF